MSRIVYIRCPTCNKVLANKEHIYQTMTKTGHSAKEALDALELGTCCRIRMLGHADVSNDILEQRYYNFMNKLNHIPSLNEYPELQKEYVDPFQFGESDSLFTTNENIKII